jgi:glyoxylase-like metal-dependent hydrolase (beta-lactamase superfamily II)
VNGAPAGRLAGALLLAAATAGWHPVPLSAQVTIRPRAFSPTDSSTIYPVRRLAEGVYLIPGDTGQGAEGRPNAGFIDTREGILVVGGLASPVQGEAVVRTIRTVSHRPIVWFMLYAHHPDMQFGTIALRHAGAKVIAHPDVRVLAMEAGPDQMIADWDQVVGLQEMLGFEYADTPDWPVTGLDSLRLGGKLLQFIHPGAAHSAGDLMLWLPKERILFAGDVLVADGITMVVDGSSAQMLKALDLIDSLKPNVIVPGHGAIPAQPSTLVEATRRYLTELRDAMSRALERGLSQRKALDSLPPPDANRPVSAASRKRRNAVTVYLEMEKARMGLE